VNLTDLLDSHDPLSTLISINNDGYLTLNSVQALCVIPDLVDIHGNTIHDARIATDRWTLGDIAPDGRSTISFSGVFGMSGPFKIAEMTIVVTYRPDFVWWKKTKEFHFTGIGDENGRLHWTQVPSFGL